MGEEMAVAGVTIKGTKDGLLVTLGDGALASLLAELAERLKGTASFFKGAWVALAVGQRELSAEELERIKSLLAQNEVTLGTVISESPVTRAVARHLGLQTKRSPSLQSQPAWKAEEEFSEGGLIQRTLRSGQVVRHPGHVVIIGDVNDGAEVIAGGDIVIWGSLRGTVHAGAMGNDQAIVCALELAPTQLRIGKHIARPPEDKPEQRATPEVAFIEEGKIIVKKWKPDRW
jgi:septum site-determining protein MinC